MSFIHISIGELWKQKRTRVNVHQSWKNSWICGKAGPAAAKVAKEFGIVDDLYIMAIDAVDETKDLIRDGSIEATMEQNFYGVGYISAQVIYDYVTTGKKPKTYDIDSGSFPVTKDNVDALQEGYDAVMKSILDKI